MEKRLNKLLNLSFDSVNEGIYIMKGKGEIVHVNDFVSHYLGYARDEILGKKVWELDPNFHTRASFEKIKSEQRHYFETVHQSKNGRHIPVEVCNTMHDIRRLCPGHLQAQGAGKPPHPLS